METEKLVFLCGACDSKLVVDKEVASKYLRYEADTWYGKPTGALTMCCFCKGVMTAYTNGADGAFVDDIEKVTNEFERVIGIAYGAAQDAVDNKRRH